MGEGDKDKQGGKEKGDDFSKLEAKIEAQLAEVSGKLDDIKNKPQESRREDKKDKDDDFDLSWLKDDEDEKGDGYVTGKQLGEVLKEIKELTARTVTETVAEAVPRMLGEFQSRANKDSLAARDFPMLNKSSGAFDSEFVSLVEKEIKDRVARGRLASDPDLLYDCAATVKARYGKWDRSTREALDDENRRFNNTVAGFGSGRRGKLAESGPTLQQIEIAKANGIPEDRFKAIYKKYELSGNRLKRAEAED